MSVINFLSPHVADLIAAGEVVERPASVVKELMENAIDAGARNITVEIRSGGMSSIRISDDGCGMTPEDAGVAFLRHATSKLRDERDLEHIATLGFRGEALAAISAVSRIELTTRAKNAAEGTRVVLSAGNIDEMGPCGCPEGTTMLVKDLFYNTPARQKFMKSDRAEGSACVNAALRVALGHPEISVRCIKEGEEEFFSPGDGQARSAVYSLLGRETAMNLLECSGSDSGISVSGFVSAPHAGRGNRAMQFFFINGRAFRSATLQAAVEQAYRNTILTGRFPACVLYITIGFGRVDVNVHPTKSEVKFSEEKQVFDAVYYAVLSALEEKNERRTAEIRLSPSTQKTVSPKADFFRRMTAEEYRSSGIAEKAEKSAAQSRGFAPVQTRFDLPDAPKSQITLRDNRANYAASPTVARPDLPRTADAVQSAPAEAAPTQASQYVPAAAAVSEPTPEVRSAPAAPHSNAQAPAADFSAEPASDASGSAPADSAAEGAAAGASPAFSAADPGAPAPSVRLIGEALNTYILVEHGDELLLIDKHACHERIIFDRLLAGLGEQMSQTLLTPVTWSPGAAEVELLEQNMALLDAAGFEIARFGDDGVIVRAVPADADGSEIAMLEEIIETLRSGKPGDPREIICHTIACKAAIKAGSRSDPRELAVLAEKVVSGAVRYCPHGRPVSVRLTKTELDKQFKRIV